MRTQETVQLRTMCDKRPSVPITSGNFEAKIFRHSHLAMAQNGSHSGSLELNYSDHWEKYMNSIWRIDD